MHNLLVYVIWALCGIAKRKDPAEKLIQADAERPEVNKVIIAFSKDDVGCHIVGGSDNGKGLAHLVVLGADDLRSREIDELHVALGVDHEVFRLYVPADYLVVLEVFEDEDDGCSVEDAVLSGKQADVSDNFVEIFPADILLQVEQEVVSLIGFPQLYNKWECDRTKYLFLLVDEFLHFVLFEQRFV